jgi:hypothetical protein
MLLNNGGELMELRTEEKQFRTYLHGYDAWIDGVGGFLCLQRYGFGIDL